MEKKDDLGHKLYKEVKCGAKTKYKEEIHCPLILNVMNHKDKGTVSAFCVEAGIGDTTFYVWLREHEIFMNCYALGKMIARENWEKLGREIYNEEVKPGTSNYKFEYWRVIGWSRFGVGKNSRIRLNLKSTDSPNEHYSQLLKQASEGDFTAGEIKQLMEAINVGLNAHQVFALQKEIDQLKKDLATMSANSNVENFVTTK